MIIQFKLLIQQPILFNDLLYLKVTWILFVLKKEKEDFFKTTYLGTFLVPNAMKKKILLVLLYRIYCE